GCHHHGRAHQPLPRHSPRPRREGTLTGLTMWGAPGFWRTYGGYSIGMAATGVERAENASRKPLDWWQRGVIYQIYSRSFADADGDGGGDLRGILSRLDYLGGATADSLGVEAIWLSPFYRSPMADFGYDISDYTDVDPVFGTLDDFDALVAAAHGRGIKVIVDWVPNHTSDQHPWFLESR